MKKNNAAAKPRTLRVSDAVWLRARQLAKADDRTVSNWVAKLIQQATERAEK